MSLNPHLITPDLTSEEVLRRFWLPMIYGKTNDMVHASLPLLRDVAPDLMRYGPNWTQWQAWQQAVLAKIDQVNVTAAVRELFGAYLINMYKSTTATLQTALFTEDAQVAYIDPVFHEVTPVWVGSVYGIRQTPAFENFAWFVYDSTFRGNSYNMDMVLGALSTAAIIILLAYIPYESPGRREVEALHGEFCRDWGLPNVFDAMPR